MMVIQLLTIEIAEMAFETKQGSAVTDCACRINDLVENGAEHQDAVEQILDSQYYGTAVKTVKFLNTIPGYESVEYIALPS